VLQSEWTMLNIYSGMHWCVCVGGVGPGKDICMPNDRTVLEFLSEKTHDEGVHNFCVCCSSVMQCIFLSGRQKLDKNSEVL